MTTLNTCPFSASMIICFFNWGGGLAPSTSLRLPGHRLWLQLPPYLFSLRGFTHPRTPTCCIDIPAAWFFSREVSEVSCLPIRLPYGIPLLMRGKCERVTAPAHGDLSHSSSLQLTSACPGRQWGHKSLATFHSQDGQGYFP